jgi:hypothetical protein
VYLRASGTWWLNGSLQGSPALQQAYRGMGWLMAQALTNKCTLGLPVAPLLFCHITAPTQPLQVRHTSAAASVALPVVAHNHAPLLHGGCRVTVQWHPGITTTSGGSDCTVHPTCYP